MTKPGSIQTSPGDSDNGAHLALWGVHGHSTEQGGAGITQPQTRPAIIRSIYTQ